MILRDLLDKILGKNGLPACDKIEAAIAAETAVIAKSRARRREIASEIQQAILDADIPGHHKLADEDRSLVIAEDSAAKRLEILEQHLDQAKAIKRHADLDRRRQEFQGHFRKVRDLAERLAQANVEAGEMYDRARSEFGDRLAAEKFIRVSYFGIVLPDLVASWVANIENSPIGVTPFHSRPAPPRAELPHLTPREKMEIRERNINPKYHAGIEPSTGILFTGPDHPPQPRFRPPRPLRRDVAKDGEVLIQMLRGGMEYADGDVARIGDVIAVTPDYSEKLIKSGAADHYRTPSAADAPQSGEAAS